MKKEAIFHRTYSEYSFAEAADLVVIRLRAAKADLESCTLCFGDRMEPKSPISITEAEMTLRFSDAMFDYFEVEIDPGVTRLCYYFRLSSGGEALYYYSDCFHEQPEENRQLYYNFHYIRSEDMDSVPLTDLIADLHQLLNALLVGMILLSVIETDRVHH